MNYNKASYDHNFTNKEKTYLMLYFVFILLVKQPMRDAIFL